MIEQDIAERLPWGSLQGEIVLTRNNGPITDAVAIIVLEDCSLVDAPAEEIVRCRLCDIAHDGKSTTKIPFSLAIEALDPHRYYSVRVHISQSGSSEVRIGDYVSTESCPVFVWENKRQLSVEVRAVK